MINIDTYYYSIFHNTDISIIFGKLKEYAISMELRGWIRKTGEKKCEILVQGPKKSMLEYKNKISKISEKVEAEYYSEYKHCFFEFNELASLNNSIKEKEGYTAYLDTVSHTGEIIGWIVNHANIRERVKVRIFIDEEDMGIITADDFRQDLLEKGISDGFSGIRYKCNEKYLDGNIYNVRITLGQSIKKDNQLFDEEIKGIIKKNFFFPFNTNLKPSWVMKYNNQDEDIRASISNSLIEKKYLYAKNEIMYGDIEVGKNIIKEILELEPTYVFRDFGFVNRYKNHNLYYPTFRDRLLHRWGKWFGEEVCIHGQNCCKLLNLPFNNHKLRQINMPSNIIFENYYKKCPYWPRFFATKNFTKYYAIEKNIPISKTLLCTESIEELRKFNFPQNYVLKPNFETCGISIFLMFGNLNLADGCIWKKDEIFKKLQQYKDEKTNAKFIVEEFLHQNSVAITEPFIPIDYRLHAFNGKVRIIQTDDSNYYLNKTEHNQQAWYSRNWVESPVRMRKQIAQSPYLLPPANLQQIIDLGDKISRDVQCYVRIDLYNTNNGPVLGEITSFPHAGNGFTEMGDLIFSQLWEIYEEDKEK